MSVEVTLSYYNFLFQTRDTGWYISGLNNSNFFWIMVSPAQANTAWCQVTDQYFNSDNSTFYMNYNVTLTGSDFFNAKLLQAPG